MGCRLPLQSSGRPGFPHVDSSLADPRAVASREFTTWVRRRDAPRSRCACMAIAPTRSRCSPSPRRRALARPAGERQPPLAVRDHPRLGAARGDLPRPATTPASPASGDELPAATPRCWSSAPMATCWRRRAASPPPATCCAPTPSCSSCRSASPPRCNRCCRPRRARRGRCRRRHHDPRRLGFGRLGAGRAGRDQRHPSFAGVDWPAELRDMSLGMAEFLHPPRHPGSRRCSRIRW